LCLVVLIAIRKIVSLDDEGMLSLIVAALVAFLHEVEALAAAAV
jgi:hypothetical protein